MQVGGAADGLQTASAGISAASASARPWLVKLPVLQFCRCLLSHALPYAHLLLGVSMTSMCAEGKIVFFGLYGGGQCMSQQRVAIKENHA